MSARARPPIAELSLNTPVKKKEKRRRDSSGPPARKQQLATPQTTPRFKTNLKSHADRSTTEGIHRSRCPCVILKELKRELQLHDDLSDKSEEIKSQIAELELNGCHNHREMSTRLITRQQIEKNQEKVSMHTVRGKQKMIRELERDEFEDRKRRCNTELQMRKKVFFVMKEHETSQIDKLNAQSEFKTFELFRRTELAAQINLEFLKLYNRCNESRVLFFREEETRVRSDYQKDQLNIFQSIISSELLQQEEYSSRINLLCEHQEGVQYIYDCSCQSTQRNLLLEENTFRDVIEKGEKCTIRMISSECRRNEIATEIAIQETSSRLSIRASESYEADEIYLAACGGRVQHCKHSEACQRGDIESEQSTTFYSIHKLMIHEGRIHHLVNSESQFRREYKTKYHTEILDTCIRSQRLSETAIANLEHREFSILSRLFSDESARQYFIHETEYMARCSVVHDFWVDLVSAFNIWDVERTNMLLDEEVEVRDLILSSERDSRLGLLVVIDEIHIMEDEIAERECIETIAFENLTELCHTMFDEHFVYLEVSESEYRSFTESSEMSSREQIAITFFGNIATTMLVECEEQSRFKLESKFYQISEKINLSIQSEVFFITETSEEEERHQILNDEAAAIHQLYNANEFENRTLRILHFENESRSEIISEEELIIREGFLFKEHLHRSCTIEVEGLVRSELWSFFMARGIIRAEAENRYSGIMQELTERKQIITTAEWLHRCDLESQSEMFWWGIRKTRSLALSMSTFHMACDATAQDILNEQSRSWDELMTSHYEESKYLFEYIEEFRALKQHFNDKQVILSQGKWELPDGMERRCAGDPQFFNLLRHATYLCDATEYHYKAMLDRSYSDIGRLRAELSSSKAEISRTKEDLRETDTHLRLENSNRIKLQASFKTVKDKCEQLDRERRSTSSANEKTKLEKRIRDLELHLHTTQNALEKERSRSIRRR